MLNELEKNFIKIEYTDSTEEEAAKLRTVLEQNSIFIVALLSDIKVIRFTDNPKNRKSSILEITCIEDLKQYLKQRIPNFIKQLTITDERYSKDTEVIFLKFLILNKLSALKNYSIEFAQRDDLEQYINSIYSLVAASYYTEPIDYIDSLLKMDNIEKKLLFDWLNKRRRYDLLNHLLEEQYKLLIEDEDEEKMYDPFMKQNIDDIIELSQKDILNGNIIMDNEIKKDLPPLSKDELDKLVTEFLIQLDPSLKWLKIYNEVKEQNIIIYETATLEDENNWMCTPIDKKWHIRAPLTGTIRDFRCLIHELTHYVSLKNDPETLQPPALKEFPPIFFETLAIKFLSKKGYSDELILELLKERNKWTQDNILNISPTLKLLSDYLHDGPLSFEAEKQKELALISKIPEDLPEEIAEELKNIKQDIDQKVIYNCDIENGFLLKYPTAILDEYPYVMGNYFAKKTLSKLEDNPMLIYEVFDITENLSRATPEEVISRLQLDTTEFSTSKDYQYQKN